MKQWIRLLCLSLLTMVTGMASAQDVVEISTVDQLKTFRDNVNSGNTYAGKTVRLTADLDLSGESNWTPIGNLVAYPGQSFNGTFDGNNHVISNVTVVDNTPNHAVAGLFGSIVNGTIKDLTVRNVNLQSTHYAGGIVAYTSNGPTIENCKVIGGTISSTPEIVGSSYDNGDKVGGIMGYATAGSTINNCWVEGVTITAYRDLGGIVGYSAGTVTNNTVKNVTVTQDLTNGYKDPTPTTIGDIIGRDGGATLSNNIVIRAEYVAQIGDVQFETLAAAVAAANTGDVIQIIKAGDYTLPGLPLNITVDSQVEGVVFSHTSAGNIASIPNGATFKNVTFDLGNVNYHGFQHAGIINMEGCTLNGKLFSYGDMNFTNCAFNQTNSDYHMWAYSGDLTYTGCTFTNSVTGKFLNIYNESGATKYTVTVEGCAFVNSGSSNKAALNVKATCNSTLLQYDVIINNCTTEGSFPSEDVTQPLAVLNNLVQVDDRTADGVDYITVTQDGVQIYPIVLNYVAQIGDEKYQSLQAAVNAAQQIGGSVTVNIISEISGETVTVNEVANFKLTIDGKKDDNSNYNVDAIIVVDGLRGHNGSITNGASVTLQNIAFVNGDHSSTQSGAIIQPCNYPHHLTIQDCTYSGSDTDASRNKWFIEVSKGPLYGAEIKNVTVEHSRLLQGDLALDVVFENITATNDIYSGFNIKTSGTLLIKDCQITTAKYALRDYKDNYVGTITLEGNTFTSTSEESDEGVIVNRGGEVGTTHINVVSGTYTGHVKVLNNKEGILVISGGYFSEEVPQDYIVEGKVCVTATDKPGYFTIGDPNYVAQIGDVKYETLQAALDAAEAANTENIVIDLLKDAELDITAWSGTKNPLAIGTADTKSITINGNNNKLTFNQKNSDWNNVATMNDEVTKLIINDMTITSAGYNNGPWNRHDINFNCAVELNNVTSDKALAFKNDATLNNVTISDTSGSLYGIWIQPNGQNVSINGLNLTAERGIKIDDQYVDNPGKVNLDIANATFNTTKKSAIIVKSGAETAITVGEGINIENVAADNVNLVWVDEDRAEDFYLVTVDGATVMPESKESDYVACLMKGEQRWGYYDALADAIAKVEEGYSIKLHQTTTEAVEVSKPLTITKNGFTADNVTAGEGFVREDTDDEIIIREMNAVAQIGSVKYETLAAAVAAVPADGTETTITMIDNETINVVGSAVTIPATKNVILDLNGYQVVGTAEGGSTSALITNKGTLTIKDSSDTNADGTGTGKLISGATTTWIYNGDGNYAGSYASNTITNSGNLTIESGYIENLSTGSATYAVDNNSSGGNAILNMEGGLLKAHSVAVREFANSTTFENTVNVSGGIIEAGYSAIWIQLPGSDATKAMKAALNVTGGTLEGGSYAFYDYSYGNAFTNTLYNLDGGTYNGVVFSYGANISITDGTYNGAVAIEQTKPSDVSVSGGKFADDVYTYGDNASTGFITGGVYAITTYEYEGTTYDCDWTQLLAEGYTMTENTDEATMDDYPYTVVKDEDDVVALVDGEAYPYPEGKECTTVTYQRTFKASQVNNMQAWYVPFDYTPTDEDKENFDFYRIHFVAADDEEGQVEDNTKVYIYYMALKENEQLKANKPYFIKPKSAMTYTFTADVDKVYAIDNNSCLDMSTAEFKYNFYGTYDTFVATQSHDFLAMSNGLISWNLAAGNKLGSYRWYIKVTSKTGSGTYDSNINFVLVESDETNEITRITNDINEIEGIYTMGGIKVEHVVKGINIIKYKNGTTKKITINK